MPHDHSAVQLDAAEPLAAASSAHDQTQAQTQSEMHAECAEQGTVRASFDLESPPEHSHAQPPKSDLGAGSPLPHIAPRHVVDPHQRQAAAGVTRDAQESTAIPTTPRTMNRGDNPYHVAPPSAVEAVEPLAPAPRDATPPPPPTPQSLNTATTTATTGPDSPTAKKGPYYHTGDTYPQVLSSLHQSTDGAADKGKLHEGKMIFGHHASASNAQRRRNFANTNVITDYEADLTSKDRAKQKEAVKKFLTEKVRTDWKWEWPRPPPDSDSSPEQSPAADQLTFPDEDWKERDEWLSCGSENEVDAPIPTTISSPDSPTPTSKQSPYRFESPDGIGETIKRTVYERKRRRKKRLAEEMAWNEGLRCFVGRRDAWTGARRVSRPGMGFSPLKPTVTAQRSSLSSEDGGSSTAIEQDDDEWEEDIEIPIAPAILPQENAMRASILPAAYNTIYDKVVVQALTPSCPMNLKDITRSCVQGWKRDGEWPPKGTAQEPAKKKTRKLSVAGLFGLEKHDEKEKEKEKAPVSPGEKSPTEKGAIRRSLQRILSLGHGGKEPAEGQ
ncbi:Protein of unknown function (DUF4050) domain containing protein [Hyaloscypha variabilis]